MTQAILAALWLGLPLLCLALATWLRREAERTLRKVEVLQALCSELLAEVREEQAHDTTPPGA